MFDYSIFDTVIYHANCADGIAAAWCIWTVLPDEDACIDPDVLSFAEYIPAKYGNPPPDVKDKNVLIVDFSYKKDVMIEMLKVAKHIRILDHHKSAEELKELFDLYPNFSGIIDMDRSGAQIAYDEIEYTGKFKSLNYSFKLLSSRFWIIDHIADRDLWKWEIPTSKDTTRAMFILNMYTSIRNFQNIIEDYELYLERGFKKMSEIGRISNSEHNKRVQFLTNKAYYCTYNSPTGRVYKVRLVPCTHDYASDVGSNLVEDNKTDFAVLFRYDFPSKTWYCSTRASKNSDIDLIPILKEIDKQSGGHKKAAGFEINEDTRKNLHTFFKLVDKETYEN